MSSTYSSSLRVELIGSGDQAGAWGATTDNSFAYVFDTAIAGYQAVPITSTSQALTYVNGATATANLNQAVYAMLKFTGASAATSVYIPPVSKQYIVYNNSGYAITIYNSTVIGNTTAAGTGITVANGDAVTVWSDGTNVYGIKSNGISGTLPIANGGTGQTTAVAAFNALSTSAVYIDGSSNVGIGTASPSTEGTNIRLAVVGTAGQQASSLATSNSNAGFTVRGNSSSGYQLAIGATNNGSIPYIQGVNYNGGAASADLAIQAYGGNVGIGTTSPSVKLDVTGSIKASVSVTSASDFIGGGASGYAALYGNSTGGVVVCRGSSSTNDIEFYTNNTERMRIDSSGNVGIGTSSGTRKLNVYGGASGTRTMTVTSNASEGLEVGVNASNIAAVNSAAGGAIIFTQADTERMRIDSSGNVGIGTTSPSTYGKFAVVSSTAGAAKISIQDTSGGSASPLLQFGMYDSSGFNTADAARIWTTAASASVARLNFAAYNAGAPSTAQMTLTSGNLGIGTTSPGYKLTINTSAGTASFYTTDAATSDFMVTPGAASGVVRVGPVSGAMAFYSANSERMRIDSSGNVGIGTTSPTTKVSIVTPTSNAGLNVNDGTVNTILYNTSSTTGSLGTTTNHPMAFYTNNTERMRIDSAGALIVGGTSTNPISTRTDGISIGTPTGFSTSRGSSNWAMGVSSTSGNHIVFYTDDGTAYVSAGTISSNGSTTSYNATSDYRLKDNVQPLTNALNRITQLRPVTWTWKEGHGGTRPNCEGFIAHELQSILPVAVTGEKDAMDKDGNPIYQGIDTSFLVATLTAAIQEQQSLIQSLTTRITALENK